VGLALASRTTLADGLAPREDDHLGPLVDDAPLRQQLPKHRLGLVGALAIGCVLDELAVGEDSAALLPDPAAGERKIGDMISGLSRSISIGSSSQVM
jgi:hypothetical protein